MSRFSLLLCGILMLLSCGPTTHIVDSWRDPEVTVDTAKVHKFVVAALLKNQTVRHQVEEGWASLPSLRDTTDIEPDATNEVAARA